MDNSVPSLLGNDLVQMNVKLTNFVTFSETRRQCNNKGDHQMAPQPESEATTLQVRPAEPVYLFASPWGTARSGELSPLSAVNEIAKLQALLAYQKGSKRMSL